MIRHSQRKLLAIFMKAASSCQTVSRPLYSTDAPVRTDYASSSEVQNSSQDSLWFSAELISPDKGDQGRKRQWTDEIIDEDEEQPEQVDEERDLPVEVSKEEMENAIPTWRPQRFRKERKAYNLMTLVNDSESLQNLVNLGVNLAEVQQNHQAGQFFAGLNWEGDVTPRVEFLVKRCGVPLTELGPFFTKNPWIFKQDLEDLDVRINYLQSKNFSRNSIARIVVKASVWLNMPVKIIDERLGWLQREFSLSGDEVRYIVTGAPKLVIFGTGHIQILRFSFREVCGFKASELKEIMLKDPLAWLTDKRRLEDNFDYLQNTIGFSHRRIIEYPRALRTNPWFLKQRHEFLKHLGRDQYDPEKPGYISLKQLLVPDDLYFATAVAKTKVSVFNAFLKSL